MVKKLSVNFQPSNCAADVCTVNVMLDFTSRTYVYLKYPFQTSYFVYTKGQRFSDISKKYSYMTDSDQCFPVQTFDDFDRVSKQLGIPPDFKGANFDRMQRVRGNIGANTQISPCGLKAALYDKIGSLSLINADTNALIYLNKDKLVHKRYTDNAVSSDNDYINVRDQTFLSWYVPQVPGFGTKVFMGVLDQGLSGNVKISFDESRL